MNLSFDIIMLFPIFFFSFFVFAAIVGSYIERRVWNNGICAESGLPWKFSDVDSQGGRGYSDGAGNNCWISYPVDNVV